MTKKKKSKAWIWIIIGILILSSAFLGYKYYQTHNYLIQNKQDSDNQIQILNNQLTQCKNELNTFKSSPDYYYSIRMNPKDSTIKKVATNAIKEFEDSSDCLEYGSRNVCELHNMVGDCISYSTDTYCKKINYAKKYYSSLDELDKDTDNGMEHYYAKAIIANYYWVRDNIDYVLGASGTGAQTDLETLELMAGKCDEQAVLLSSLLRSVGLDAHPVLINDINHAITAVKFPKNYKTSAMKGWSVTINDEYYLLLDTTCSNCEINELPDIDKNQNVVILDFYDV